MWQERDVKGTDISRQLMCLYVYIKISVPIWRFKRFPSECPTIQRDIEYVLS